MKCKYCKDYRAGHGTRFCSYNCQSKYKGYKGRRRWVGARGGGYTSRRFK